MRQVGVGIILSSRWGGGLRSSSGLTIGAATQRCPKIFPSFMPDGLSKRNG